MIERYFIVAVLILSCGLAGWYIAHGKPLHVPTGTAGHCQQLTCNLVQRVMILRRVV